MWPVFQCIVEFHTKIWLFYPLKQQAIQCNSFMKIIIESLRWAMTPYFLQQSYHFPPFYKHFRMAESTYCKLERSFHTTVEFHIWTGKTDLLSANAKIGLHLSCICLLFRWIVSKDKRTNLLIACSVIYYCNCKFSFHYLRFEVPQCVLEELST